MSKKQFIKRHLLLINKLKKSPCSFDELQKHLQYNSELDEENYTISVRTMQRDINEIKSLYNIEIKFNRKQGVYEINDEQEDFLSDRVLDTFTILDTLKLAENFSDAIVFEQRKTLGLENIFLLVHAIKNQLEITFEHKKYWEDIVQEKSLQPYFVKESKQRWYIVGKEKLSNEIRTFGLDRISNIYVSKNRFKKPTNSVLKNLFQNSFGVIYDQKAPQKIVLEFSAFQAKYIKSLPLHSSQKIVNENKSHCTIELFIYPTYDFVMEILSMRKEVKVIEPASLKDEIKNKLIESLKNY